MNGSRPRVRWVVIGAPSDCERQVKHAGQRIARNQVLLTIIGQDPHREPTSAGGNEDKATHRKQ